MARLRSAFASYRGGVFDREWTTDDFGQAWVDVDLDVRGDVFVMASHPDARTAGVYPLVDPRPLVIALERFDTSDNVNYAFNDPGVPGRRDTTAQCGHCHRTTNDQWATSVHAQSARSPVLHDVYAGVASALTTHEACDAAGGRWAEGLQPGTRERIFRCYLGDGFLLARNPECRDTSCDGRASEVGNCADCHAPGIDGVLGGRGFLEATGLAFSYGIHCDVCHRVESVDLEAPPGVGGRLVLLRPSELGSPSLGSGGWLPLTFVPSPDSPNPRMGSVARGHFRESTFCAGCHELAQTDFNVGATPDPVRWPSGRLPIQSTYTEWKNSSLETAAPCQSCHMPPDPAAGNHADIQIYSDPFVGIPAGWYRPAGSMRKHNWVGPRTPNGRMLALAAIVTVSTAFESGRLTAQVTVKNVGAGHAIPTGEPLRHLLVEVSAKCDGMSARPIGGSVVPDYGGYRRMKADGEDWSVWPTAEVGDRIRVIADQGYVGYVGFGPFGDGRFNLAEKGLRDERFVGETMWLATTVFCRRSPLQPTMYSKFHVQTRLCMRSLFTGGIRYAWPGKSGGRPILC